MKLTPLVFSVCTLVSALSCNAQAGKKAAPNKATAAKTSFQTNPNGLEYNQVTKGSGTASANVGDFMEFNLKFKIGDSLLIDTWTMNEHKPVTQQVQAPTMKGDLMEGLMTMKAGDSTVFRIPMDTLSARAGQPKPPFAKPGDYAIWEVKMVSIKTKAQMEAESAAKEKAQAGVDDKLIQDYFKSKGINNAKKTATGLYYVVHKEGTGAVPADGSKVTVNYTGQNLKGEKFDSNVDPAFHHVEPFTFDLGKRGVIRGWDEGVALMKKGTKATFYIPSHLAYGERGAGPKIPGNSVLIFDIELIDFK